MSLPQMNLVETPLNLALKAVEMFHHSSLSTSPTAPVGISLMSIGLLACETNFRPGTAETISMQASRDPVRKPSRVTSRRGFWTSNELAALYIPERPFRLPCYCAYQCQWHGRRRDHPAGLATAGRSRWTRPPLQRQKRRKLEPMMAGHLIYGNMRLPAI